VDLRLAKRIPDARSFSKGAAAEIVSLGRQRRFLGRQIFVVAQNSSGW
jgi:hypothetical protein